MSNYIFAKCIYPSITIRYLYTFAMHIQVYIRPKTFLDTIVPVKNYNVFSSFSKQIILHTFKYAVLNQNHCHFKHCCCSCISVAICVLQVLLTSNRLIGRGVNIRCHLLELTLTPLLNVFFSVQNSS